MRLLLILLALSPIFQLPSSAATPNLIFILADDLGYGDLGCFGSEHVKTPRLDQMAAEGIKLTDFYSGANVCAPSRCVLMTGLHMGHGWVRGNAGNVPKQTLQTGEITVPSELKKAGYATGLFGKWGIGEIGSTGHPLDQGFDTCYGYLNQRHAHNFYPTFLVHDREIIPTRNEYSPDWIKMRTEQGRSDDGAGWADPAHKLDYAPTLIMEKAHAWIEKQNDTPFFLYLALNMPHANNEATKGTGDGQEVPGGATPDYGVYADKDWPNPDKGQAAMITLMDTYTGNLIDQLEKLGIAENTLILFSSDNGPHAEGGNNMEFFAPSGPVRGMKRDLTDGGIRVPTLAYWPGTIAPGTVSDRPAYFGDLLATACDLANTPCPEGRDSISFLPTLKGKGRQRNHQYLYWESYEKGGKQALRFGNNLNWKMVKEPWSTGTPQLYNLAKDIGEETDLASQFPEKVQQAEALAAKAHTPDPNWKIPQPKKKK